jgi:RNA polymerase sigma-70 factor (ECF subfamily)
MIAFAKEYETGEYACAEPDPTPADDGALDFEEAALPHRQFLYRFGLRLSGEAYKAWHRFDPSSNVRAWLATILRNTFINEHRRRKREVDHISVETLETFAILTDGQDSDPEGDFFAGIVDDEVVRAIDALPSEYKRALVLSDMHGLPYAAIAREVGAPLGTVKSRVHRARQALQTKLYSYATEMGYVRGELALAS